MAASLEMRLPLLDHRIVEFSWRCPTHLRYRDGVSKWLLRQVLYRYVPRELIERPKMGFSAPISSWLRGPLRDWASELLRHDNLTLAQLNPTPIEVAWKEHLSGARDHAHQLWTVLMLLAWVTK